PGGPASLIVSWEDLASVASATTGGGPRGSAGGRCFAVRAHAHSTPGALPAPEGVGAPVGPEVAILEEVQVFSAQTNRRYSLLATAGAPTMLVSGVQMHRTSGEDPWRDTLAKVRCVAPVVGRVLDTCTGLGYTAIVAAGSAGSAGSAGGAGARAGVDVLTIEIDPGAVAVARLNPWSRPLFEHPRIERRMGDSAEVVEELPDGAFARIVHDPPVLSLAGDLYSGAFYRHLHRVLGRGGRLFHYVGNAASGSGRRVTRGVQQRLHEAGFSRVLPRPEAFGVLALK
ncbi:MAG TPA: hypothetical protein VH257_10545, partial [Chloroflexota bacterium]|nr:hypothetical protein [Chloroflexota bacterium]